MRRVYGEGPIPCKFLFIGEYPGIDEIRFGRPFVGKSGRELTRYLNGYDLPAREDVYLTNLRKVPYVKGEPFLSAEDEAEIQNELSMIEPDVIVTMGAHVLQHFCGPDATLEAYHGIPHPATGPGLRDVPIFPLYNPAAMLHSPTLQSVFAYDMRRLALFLRGTLPASAVDERPGDYSEWPANGEMLELKLHGQLAVDTEGWKHQPWGLSYSDRPYFGRVVRAQYCTEYVRVMRNATDLRVWLHNSLHDLGVLRALGWDLIEEGVRFDDTMIMAYLLGLEPQGLKPLCYRHNGMQMQDYSELTAIPSAAIAEVWLDKLAQTLPEKRKKPTRKKDREGFIEQVGQEKILAHARTLIENMIAKNEPQTLRTRWDNGRAKEILVDEERVLPFYEADPPEATLDDVEPDESIPYAGRDADGTGRLAPKLSAQIDLMGLRDVYETDIAVVPMFERMQQVGLGIDIDHFTMLADFFALEEELHQEKIREQTGRDLNVGSGDQVAEYLFDVLQLDRHPQARHLKLKRTKSGERISTNDKILEALRPLHPHVELVQEGREIRKMRGTYAEPIPRLVNRETGRLHPNFRITRTDTGRPAASEPNVLALPKHSERGKMVRAGIIAGPGRVLSEWDLNQIEMRVFAHDSGDERMIAQFLSGRDFHRGTAAETMYHIALDAVTDAQRFTAKAINFGILMGMTEFGLADQLHKAGQLDVTQEFCGELLASWMAGYPGGAKYIETKHSDALRLGYVRDMHGRIRWLEGVHSADKYIAAEALRMAQATPIQSGAQGIIKRAMKMLWPLLVDLRASGVWVEVLLQIHDALVVEHDPEATELINEIVMYCMENAVRLSVPVTAKAVTGKHRLSEL